MVIVIVPREIIAMRHTDVIISVFFHIFRDFFYRDSNFSFIFTKKDGIFKYNTHKVFLEIS